MTIDLSSEQLRRAADLKERIDSLQAELSALLGSPSRYVSFQARARLAAAARVRWAKLRTNSPDRAVSRRRRRMSPATKARLAAVARARWRKAKAAGKNAL